MRRKLKQISNLSAHSRRRQGAGRKAGRQRGTSPGVSYEQKGGWLEEEEVDYDDDDDGDNYDDDDDVRSWVVFELRAPVVQTGNGSRRMAGMT